MASKKSLALPRPDCSEDAEGLSRAERDTLPSTPEITERPSFDAELSADVFHLTRRRSRIPSDVLGIDAGRSPVIHNAFWIAGKVPSLNDLLDAKSKNQPRLMSLIMRQKPQKGKNGGARYSVYNDIKQDWKRRTIRAIGSPFVRVDSCFFGYVIVEETLKRDPSNISSSAIKFIEDGLVEAGVIANDGWSQVLGIRTAPIHRPGRDPGVFVVMSNVPLAEERLVFEYEQTLPVFSEL